MTRRVQIRIDPHFFQEVFNFPDGAELVDADWDTSRQLLVVYLESDKFPNIQPGTEIPCIVPQANTITDRDGHILQKWWTWNYPDMGRGM